MRVIVKPDNWKVPIPILFPSILIFNPVTGLIGLMVLLMLRCTGKYTLPLPPFACFWLFLRLMVRYWSCRLRIPGWKLVDVCTKDAKVSIKL